MARPARQSCRQCQQLQAQVNALQARVDALLAEVTQLREQWAAAKKNSSTSSKPPASDIVKPPADDSSSPRPAGGQPGHPKHKRAPFPPEQVTCFEEHLLQVCPCCGGGLRRNGHLARVVQQVEIAKPPLTIEQHTSPEFWCVRCQKAYKAPPPSAIEKGGLVGPQLTALIAYLKGACHASYSTVRKFLRDVVGLSISRGQLAKVIAKVSAALDGPYQELLPLLAREARLNVDETGHKDNGTPMWTWCFRAELYTLFKIDPHRRADVLLEVLGQEFDGVLGCDCFSAYRRYMRECDVVVQFCLAHLIRDVKFLLTLPGRHDRAYGQRLCDALRALFGVIHRRDQVPASRFPALLAAARDAVLPAGTQDVPAGRHAQRMA